MSLLVHSANPSLNWKHLKHCKGVGVGGLKLRKRKELYKEAVSVHVPGDYIVTNFDRFMILFKIALAKLLFDDMT
jgi:hypothetical protein